MASGIYKIVNVVNGKVYVGSAVNLTSRLNTHKHNLRKGKHPNLHLRSAWNKYGEENFTFEIIELCDKDFLLAREQFWIDLYNSYEIGYNKRKDVNSNLGMKFGKQTIDHIEKRLLKIRGMKRSEETLRLMSEIGKRRKTSEETKLKLSNAGKGRVYSDQSKAKMSAIRKAKSTWLHPGGYNCNCLECNERKNAVRRRYKGPIEFIMVNVNAKNY